MITALAFGVSALACVTIALSFMVGHLHLTQQRLKYDVDHAHDVAHTALIALEGKNITLHHMKLRTDDIE